MELTGWEVITRKWENLHLLGQENILVAIRKKHCYQDQLTERSGLLINRTFEQGLNQIYRFIFYFKLKFDHIIYFGFMHDVAVSKK